VLKTKIYVRYLIILLLKINKYIIFKIFLLFVSGLNKRVKEIIICFI